MLSEKREAMQQNDGVDMLPLELGLLRASTYNYYVYQELEMQLCVSPLISSQNVQASTLQFFISILDIYI